MNPSQLIEGYYQWLSLYKWLWFGTLTFRGYPPINKAKRCFNFWINELNQKYDGSDVRWFRVTEHGADGYNLHFHVLVGGLNIVSGARSLAMLRWKQLAGEANLSSFMSHKGGIFYILKTAKPYKEFEIDFELPPFRGKSS
jgi:hypothetical protein